MTVVDTPWYLRGLYTPVHDELTETDLSVTGSIPPELAGRYLRNGSNPRSGSPGHWFFGDGMVHGVRLRDGRAEWYRNRWVRTTKFERRFEAITAEVISDPTASAANTHVLAHAGRIWALEEGHLSYELTPELDTIGCDDVWTLDLADGSVREEQLHDVPHVFPRCDDRVIGLRHR